MLEKSDSVAGQRIMIDQSRCIGAGHCASNAPGIFGQDDDGLVSLENANPGDEAMDGVRSVARLCPVSAITVLR